LSINQPQPQPQAGLLDNLTIDDFVGANGAGVF
jgi:hypothetical protein